MTALVDANGNPIALKLTEGQAHGGKSASDLPLRRCWPDPARRSGL